MPVIFIVALVVFEYGADAGTFTHELPVFICHWYVRPLPVAVVEKDVFNDGQMLTLAG